MRPLLILVFALSTICGYAQSGLTGMVTDSTGQPLAFVTILFNGTPGKGVLSDIEGRFRIDDTRDIRFLSFRYVGFEPQNIPVEILQKMPPGAVVIRLRAANYALPEAVVRAGENPADILIRKAIANRKRNNPELRRSYTCTTYNKVLFDALPDRGIFDAYQAGKDTSRATVQESIQNFERLEQAMENHHAFLMESVTERAFRFPNQVQEQVRLNRVSGFRNAGIVALANMVQPFTFYGDYLTILDKNFVNPVSPGSPDLYFFNIEDTLYSGPDTVWVLSFHPRKGKIFDGLEGVLHLHSHGWAIQNVRAQPAQSGNISLKIEQAYERVLTNDPDPGYQWFPAQLNFELEFKQYPSPFVGIRAAGRSYITDARIDPPLKSRDFNAEIPVLMNPDAQIRSDSAWEAWRQLAPLSVKEHMTYAWLDSVGQTKRFDRLSTVMDILATGRMPVGQSILSLDLRHLLRFNDYEGTRLGIGLSTAQARPLLPQRRLDVSAYTGYGFRDKAWKYGGQVLWRLTPGGQTRLSLGWRRDLLEPGTLYELPPPALVNRSLYATRMDRLEEFAGSLRTALGRFFTLEGTFRKQDVRPEYAYRFGTMDTNFTDRFQFTETTLFLRYANGERNGMFLGTDVGNTQRLPVLEVAYTRGWPDVWGSAFQYERWTASLYHSFFLGKLGRTRWRVEAGWASPDAPLAKLFTLNQTGGNWNIFVLPNTFQALPDTLFLSNRFVNLYFAQEFGPVLYQHKYSAPALTLLQNAAWGDLQQPELHQDTGFRTASTPLLESGIQLDNLLRINYVNIAYLGVGGAVFYRWGGLQADDWRDNLSFRATLRLTL
ncbi:MAG: carboxypeptidase-like regulatory domain-containing protein [Bacteroidetes bacterium]|nr:MAG: carboxypeptidase-like regulatory domain-containing protein [Bacteroidota bacterium]